VKHCVDLCAAPCSWSQVLSRKLIIEGQEDPPKIVAVDLQAMAPLKGIIQIQGDIAKQSIAEQIISHFNSQYADLLFVKVHQRVINIATYIATYIYFLFYCIKYSCFKTWRFFCLKVFRGKDITLLYVQLKVFFKHVTYCKPRSSRNSSIESFIVCKDYQPPNHYY
ncbi:hypothetical protein LY90DRAFT_413574, partial [Neocallimastix californiae]